MPGDMPLLSGTIHLNLSNVIQLPKHPLLLQASVPYIWYCALGESRVSHLATTQIYPTLKQTDTGETF